MELRYLKELDGIRGIAAVMVMFFHFFNTGPFPELVRKAAVFGQTGVTLFFVLSGFLITRILLQAKGKPGFFKTFYTRRALRIFPLYFFFLYIFYIVTPHLKDVTLEQTHPTWYFWCFLQNFPVSFNWEFYGPDHYWSLAVEEHFYMVLPFLIFFISNRRMVDVLFVVIALTIVLRIAFVLQGYQVYYFTLTTMDALAMGSLLAFYERKYGFSRQTASKALYTLIVLLPLLLFTWFYVVAKAIPVIQVIKYSLIALVYLSLIVYAASISKGHLFKQFLTSGPMLYTGRISYGLYVYHPMCFLAVQKYIGSKGVFIDLLMSFSVAYVAASLSFHFFEARILAFKKYFHYGAERAVVIAESKVLVK